MRTKMRTTPTPTPTQTPATPTHADADADSGDAFHETEAEMLERYAAIAREMAEGGSGGDDDDEGADGAGLAEEDEAFESALEPGRGGKALRAFVEWYAAWKKAGSSGMRVVSLVDPATVKTFHTRARRRVTRCTTKGGSFRGGRGGGAETAP